MNKTWTFQIIDYGTGRKFLRINARFGEELDDVYQIQFPADEDPEFICLHLEKSINDFDRKIEIINLERQIKERLQS